MIDRTLDQAGVPKTLDGNRLGRRKRLELAEKMGVE